MSVPTALSIAGLDPSGGAGVAADLKTFSALGVYRAAVVTALTAQNTKGVFGIHDVPPDFIAAQIDAVFSDLAVGAVKIGMLGGPVAIEVVAAALDRYHLRAVVLDPVMIASSGQPLLRGEALGRLRDLIARVSVLTPNLPRPRPCSAPIRRATRPRCERKPAKTFGVRHKGGADQRRSRLRRRKRRHPRRRTRRGLAARGAAHRDAKHSRHRLHIVVRHRGGPGQGPAAAGRRSRGQNLCQRRAGCSRPAGGRQRRR